MTTRILIIEDEKPIREMIRFALEREGYSVDEAGDAATATSSISRQRPDLMLVDWMLPEVSGVNLIRSLRRSEINRDIPVIMLTARGEEMDRVKGLEAGADDYMSKPVAIKELLARIRALLRRSRGFSQEETLQSGMIKLNIATHQVTINDQAVHFGQTEYRLLKFFLQHPERVYSRGQLLDLVWGETVYVEERTVDVHILRLRKLLKPYGVESMIQTVRGAGYRFSQAVES
ncbi:MAG: phosphate regulon transcriptional regulator PhoB [Pseudomonadota bacterium]|nr:phosphate regulon transcriptional regulator PhoB [Pseudomonadota bacterium]